MVEQPLGEKPQSTKSESVPRRNRARERYERRRQKQAGAPRPARPAKERAAPRRSRSMPKVDPRMMRGMVAAVGGVAFMLAVIVAVGVFTDPPAALDPNALWLDTEWTYQPQDEAAIEALVSRLRQQRVGIVFAAVSELNFDGTWTGRPNQVNLFTEVQDTVRQFAAQMQAAYPNLRLYGVVTARADVGPNNYRLDNPAVRQGIADFSALVVNDLGFDGVLLQIDPIWSGDENYLSLLRTVRQGIGETALLAVTIPPDWTPVDAGVPIPAVIAPNTVWQTDYKQRVALLQINHLVVRVYDSYLTTAQGNQPADYTAWVGYQVQAYAQALAALETDSRLLLAVSTGPASLPARDRQIETLRGALEGITQGLRAAGDAAEMVEGVAVIEDSTTSEVDWIEYRELWLER